MGADASSEQTPNQSDQHSICTQLKTLCSALEETTHQIPKREQKQAISFLTSLHAHQVCPDHESDILYILFTCSLAQPPHWDPSLLQALNNAALQLLLSEAEPTEQMFLSFSAYVH